MAKKIFKYKQLFEYYNYLENINEKSFEDIEKMSNILNNYIIIEGLIKTYPLENSIRILKRKFDYDITEGEDGEIFVYGKINYARLKSLANSLGYFNSLIIQNNKPVKMVDINLDVEYIVVFEPKYDTKIIPVEFLYHATLKKYSKNIKKVGFIPKTKNKISNHPDRIYFTSKLADAELFKKLLKKEYKEDTVIIKISTKNINNVFYSDINFKESGIYTINNISPEHINKII